MVSEIEGAVAQALAKKGITAAVVVRENVCELLSDPVVAIDLGEWVKQWNLLPADIRDRRAEAAAVRLTNALNAARGVTVVPPGKRAEQLRRFLALAFAIGVAGYVGWWVYSSGFFGKTDGALLSEPTAAPSLEPETHDQATSRVERACDAGRQRILQGDDLGVDIEGWVVELWLARPAAVEPLAKAPVLVERAAKGMVGETGAVGPSFIELVADTDETGLDGVIVRFTGGYVAQFFTVAGRGRFADVADSLADATGAELGALFARCAHRGGTRDIGAWYRGKDTAGALAALLYAAGRFAEPPAFHAAKVGMARLREASAGLEPQKRDEIFRRLGGRISERPPDEKVKTSVAIGFPLGGPTRAAQASRELAKALAL